MRVVSLVPSVTETLLALGVMPVACTRFCEHGDAIATVGGTKDPRVDEIVALAPDLVVVNDEENRREDADALIAAGVALHSMSPRTVDGVGPAVRELAARLGVAAPSWESVPASPLRGRMVAFVWRRPWMALGGDTYGSSVLERLGWANAFADAVERYPAVTLADVVERAPALVLLPSEPYPFGQRHVNDVAAAVPGARVALVDGRDLFWWGIRTPGALERLAAALA